MNQEELQVAAFEIILHSGSARTTVHEAFADMREGHYDEVIPTGMINGRVVSVK